MRLQLRMSGPWLPWALSISTWQVALARRVAGATGTALTASTPTIFVQDAKAAGMTPVFTYYQLLQTRAGAGGEAQTVLANLNDTATMQKYFTDYKVMLQKAAGFSGTKVVVHVEPDLWGYIQQRSSNDNAAVIPAKVAATGLSELAGLSNNAAGFARALVKLADLYAPNIILAYHMSSWGTGVDPVYADPTPDQVSALAIRAANFYKSLGAQFDLSFAEFTDRDDGFKASVMGKPDAFWTALDFDNHIKWLSAYSSAVGHRVVLSADSLRQSADEGPEQQLQPLPELPGGDPAGRHCTNPAAAVPRRRRHCFSFWHWCRRSDAHQRLCR